MNAIWNFLGLVNADLLQLLKCSDFYLKVFIRFFSFYSQDGP